MPNTAAISLRQVQFKFGAQPVLDKLDLVAKPGQFLAIVGPNGCGKSTTLKLMAGLLRPSTGTVTVGDTDIQHLSRRTLAQQVALLTQQGAPPAGISVYDLVAMGRFAHQTLLSRRSAEDEQRIETALEAMQVSALRNRPVGQLSGGQLQRARMAMTLAQDAAVLLLDEPTTFLDLKYQYGILEQAQAQARAGRTVVAVLHDFTQASLFADTVALMHKGRLVASGMPDRVLTQDSIAQVFDVRTRTLAGHGAVFHVPESQVR